MLEKLDRKRVSGFLKAQGQKIVNGTREEILLAGWGLGNWLLCEGYMWLAFDNRAFDRPRNIEETVRDIAGSVYAEHFWKEFRKRYITREDILRMAALGYNSVRIPINWRILMEDEPGELIFKEDGFHLLEDCVNWCEEAGIYAILDMHGAPGGQTGDNIDDSRDNLPRLLTDQDYWDKGIALWEELARRYKGRWIVGAYDLLNEPIRTVRYDYPDIDYALPALIRFYEEAVSAIRKIDPDHLLSIEGHHWATDPALFFKKYDDNMLIHFHRYGCPPDISAFQTFAALREKFDVPLWLGETGENKNEWYAALYPLAFSLDIGVNVWPWKKMQCTSSPYSVKKPEHWDVLLAYTKGGEKPSKTESVAMLDEYLENMKLENCVENLEVTNAVFRCPPCSLRATDFDQLPGKGVSFSGGREEPCLFGYQRDSGMAIRVEKGKELAWETGWDRWGIYTLQLASGEFAVYSLYRIEAGSVLRLFLTGAEEARLCIEQDGKRLAAFDIHAQSDAPLIPLNAARESRIMVRVEKGTLTLSKLEALPPAVRTL